MNQQRAEDAVEGYAKIEAEGQDQAQRDLQERGGHTPDEGIHHGSPEDLVLPQDLGEIRETHEFRLEPEVLPERVDTVVERHHHGKEHEAEVQPQCRREEEEARQGAGAPHGPEPM